MGLKTLIVLAMLSICAVEAEAQSATPAKSPSTRAFPELGINLPQIRLDDLDATGRFVRWSKKEYLVACNEFSKKHPDPRGQVILFGACQRALDETPTPEPIESNLDGGKAPPPSPGPGRTKQVFESCLTKHPNMSDQSDIRKKIFFDGDRADSLFELTNSLTDTLMLARIQLWTCGLAAKELDALEE